MKTSILIYATCFIVTGCSAQLRFPSLSSALSSLTGFGSSSASGSSAGSSASQSGQSSSPYSGLVRDYGRNLMTAMSNLYPTLFKPPQSQQQAQQAQPVPQAYDQSFGASQYASPSLFSASQSAPSFSFGGSTFSISPSLPSLPFGAGSLASASQAQQSQAPPSGSHSPFSNSFGSSINSPPAFGPLSSSSFFNQQPPQMPSYAPASSYSAAFEAANGGAPGSPFGGLGSASGLHSQGSPLSQQALLSQSTNSQSINSYNSLPSFNGQHDSASVNPLGPHQSQQQQQQQVPSLQQQQQSGLGAHSSAAGQFGPQHSANGPSVAASQAYASQQYRPDVMSLAASAPVPSSNSYSNYGAISSGPSSQQAPASPTSYQQPSYR